MNFVERIERLQKQKGVTTTQMLEDCKLGKNSMWTWKQGTIPRFSTLKVLADYFDVPISFLDDTFDGDYSDDDIVSSPDAYLLSNDEKFIIDTYRSVSDSDKLKVMRFIAKLQKPES